MNTRQNYVAPVKILPIVAGLAAAIALAAAPARGELIVGLTSTNALITFDSATPNIPTAPIVISGLQSGENILGIDFRPATGELYGLGSTSRLYTLNTATGVATQVGSSGAFTLSGTSFGFDFNPIVDRIRVVGNTGQDLRLNPNGALAATDTAINPGTPRIVGAAYTNNFSGAPSTTLYVIDAAGDNLLTQGSPNGSPTSPNTGTVFAVGPLGFDTNDLVGFDISGVTGTAYASMNAPVFAFSATPALAIGTTEFFTVNTNTGAATLVGLIAGGTVTDIAAPIGAPVPEPASLAILGLGGAILLRRRKN